jgi:hypothetical protein
MIYRGHERVNRAASTLNRECGASRRDASGTDLSVSSSRLLRLPIR